MSHLEPGRLEQLVTQALDLSLFESIEPAVKVEASDGSGAVEIPLAFAKHFASLVLKEREHNGS